MNRLGLFAKFWQPGSVKTRLAATIGSIAACKVYQTFLFHLLERHRDSADARAVVFSPPAKESEFRGAVAADWDCVAQTGGDLGQRMQSFFAQQFEHAGKEELGGKGVSKVVVIGADCPQLSQATLQSAFDQLDENQVVIGPSTDGGYYLIGMRDQAFNIFSDIQWSTPQVLEQTQARLRKQQISFGRLSTLTDVDQEQDLLELVADLQRRKALGKLDSLDQRLLKNIYNIEGLRATVKPE